MKRIELTGKRFGKLLVIRQDGKKGNHLGWLCSCDCGKETRVGGPELRTGHTKSCGCLRYEFVPPNKTHGLNGSRFCSIFRGIVKRTRNTRSDSYKKYGARGVKCLWSSFGEFKDDMYDSYLEHVSVHGEKETTIDRIDVLGDYSKENCQWATNSEQQRNKRGSLWYTHDGRTLHLKDWSLESGIPYGTLWARIRQRDISFMVAISYKDGRN